MPWFIVVGALALLVVAYLLWWWLPKWQMRYVTVGDPKARADHFVIFRGVMNDRVLLADPAWGNRTMTIDKFKRMWLDYGKRMGRVGFVVERPEVAPLSRMQPRPSEFVMFD